MHSGPTRRSFLRGAAGLTVGLPFLASLPAHAGGVPDLPRRLVVFFTPNGFLKRAWPTGTNLAGSILEPLAPWMDDVLLLRGVDMATAELEPGDNSHYEGFAHMLVADGSTDGRNGGNVSADMVVADRIGADTPLPYSLHSASLEYGRFAASWLAADQPVYAEPRPEVAFDTLFGDLDLEPDEAVRQRERRRSVLDYVTDAIADTRGRLGCEDRVRLDAHLDAIRDIEQRLGSERACAIPDPPGAIPYPSTDDAYPAAGAAHMDLLTMALACDLTRVGSMQWSGPVRGGTPTWLGIDEDHHELSHDPSDHGVELIRTICTWYAEQFAGFLARLAAVPEGDGTLLDRTVVLWISELGVHDNDAHPLDDLGLVIAGGRDLGIAGGRHLDLGGIPHNNLLLELINLLSPELDPLTSFGHPDYCTGGVPELWG